MVKVGHLDHVMILLEQYLTMFWEKKKKEKYFKLKKFIILEELNNWSL